MGLSQNMEYKTILFDLDDTIFDHQHARRCGLKKLKEQYHMTNLSINEFEKVHQYYLDLTFNKVLENQISLEESRKERILLLFNHFGINLKDDEIMKADSIYRNEYNDNRQSIPGVIELMEELKKYSKIAIITNGLHIQQDEKIKICNIGKYIDYLITSETIGCKKPDQDFYLKTLEIINNEKHECIVIGDSWEVDILGAYNAGIKSIWLNRYAAKCPNPNITIEINSYENTEEIIKFLS